MGSAPRLRDVGPTSWEGIMFTPKSQRDIGEGTLRLINGNLYVGNGRWLFRIFSPEDHFDQEIIDIVSAVEGIDGRKVDWRILNARGIDVQNETFLPHGSRKHISIYIGRMESELPDESERIEDLFEADRSYAKEPRLDLMTAFQDGQMRPVYDGKKYDPKKDLGSRKNTLTKTPTAQAYFYSDREIVVGVPAGLMTLLSELGFTLWVSTKNETNEPPIIGGWSNALRAEVLAGVVSDLHISTTPDGRKLNGSDAYRICWWTREFAEASVRGIRHYFNPQVFPQGTIIHRFLKDDDALSSQGIDALRWMGVPDSEIRDLLRRTQQEAWPDIYQQTLEASDRLLNRIIEKVTSGGDLSKWVIQSWEREIKNHCDTVEKLSQCMNEDLDLGSIPEVVEELEGLKTT
tara:strand:- start:1212 stop:2423 length:1212 start_codon:yes stop_codon:yes gene_type:complete